MSLSLRAATEIRASAERVFDLVCAPERLPEWNASIERARRVAADAPVCLGARAIFTGLESAVRDMKALMQGARR